MQIEFEFMHWVALEMGEINAEIIGEFGYVVGEQRKEGAAAAGQNLQSVMY